MNTCSIRRWSAPGRWRRSTKASSQRIEAYAVKAAREGKLETSWLNPNEDYEEGLRGFVRAILDRKRAGAFLDSFEGFARRAALLGALNSLTQLALKATMPGVPDFYQGTEMWDLSLVDPDNRRPVDFAARQAALAARFATMPSRTGARSRRTGPTDGSSSRSPTGSCRCATNCRRCFAMAATSRSR